MCAVAFGVLVAPAAGLDMPTFTARKDSHSVELTSIGSWTMNRYSALLFCSSRATQLNRLKSGMSTTDYARNLLLGVAFICS